MVEAPILSAIVSTYNSEKFIQEKLDDLLNQSISDKIEIIVINSGSKQNEDAIIRTYLGKSENIVYIKTETRETIYQAWNRGIKVARGKYITNANTDDRLRPDAYEMLIKFLEKNQEVALVYADQFISNEANETFTMAVEKKRKVLKFPNFEYIKLLDRCIIGSQPMWRSSLHSFDGILFDENFEVLGDHDFELTIAKKYKLVHLPLTLGTFYKSAFNKEYENKNRNRRELSWVREKHISEFVSNLSEEETHVILNRFRILTKIPLFLYYSITWTIDKYIARYSYRKILFHSIDFIYEFNIKLLEHSCNTRQVEKLKKRFAAFNVRVSKLKKMTNR